MLGDQLALPGEAEHLTFGGVGLYQPITKEEDAVTLSHRDLFLLIAHATMFLRKLSALVTRCG